MWVQSTRARQNKSARTSTFNDQTASSRPAEEPARLTRPDYGLQLGRPALEHAGRLSQRHRREQREQQETCNACSEHHQLQSTPCRVYAGLPSRLLTAPKLPDCHHCAWVNHPRGLRSHHTRRNQPSLILNRGNDSVDHSTQSQRAVGQDKSWSELGPEQKARRWSRGGRWPAKWGDWGLTAR